MVAGIKRQNMKSNSLHSPLGASEIAPQIKTLAAKPENLISIPGTYVREAKTDFYLLPVDLPSGTVACALTHILKNKSITFLKRTF